MVDITYEEFNTIRDYIKKNFAISLSDEKKSLIVSRLRTTLVSLNFDTFTQYFDYLLNDKTGVAMKEFISKITTNHTYWMRESDHFDYYRDVALPHIHETYGNQKDLRVWCAASSSGEEAVTLQIISQEFFKKKNERWDTEILATDISNRVLDEAVFGVYPTEALSALPKTWLTDYFSKYDDLHSKVKDDVLNKITYREFNLKLSKVAFKKKFQTIFCRNVMIYFDANDRDILVRSFYDAMDNGGYLFIGHSESLNHTGTAFKYIKPAVYRKME